MKPEYIDNYIDDAIDCTPDNSIGHFDYLLISHTVKWNNRENVPRNECFMATETLKYEYSSRIYDSTPFDPKVLEIQNKLNEQFKTNYNVCFLNYYKDDKQHLGWHADDSEHMNLEHPIAVISFGAAREIWVKEQTYKGIVPKEDRYLLNNGSLFIMPSGFQKTYYHKIPKHDRPCGGRISLTLRNYQ